MFVLVNNHPCDIFAVADQVGIKLPPMSQARKEAQPRKCFARKTLKRIGQAHGEAHLALTLRLIVESTGNAAEMHGDTITTVSAVLLSGVEAGSALFEAFDKLDLRTLREWAKVACPEMTVAAAMTAVLLWQLRADKLDEIKAMVAQARESEAALKARQARKQRRAA